MIKLNEIYTNYSDFELKTINKLKELFPEAEWLNENNSLMSFSTLYMLLDMYYGDRIIRFDNEDIFLKKINFELSDLLPDIYSKQQVFIKNELSKYLSDSSKRGIVWEDTGTLNRNTNNNSKTANSSTPVNKVITEVEELNNLPITAVNLSGIKLLEDVNSNNKKINTDYISNMVRTLKSDYSLRLKEFMNMLTPLFSFITNTTYEQQTIKYYIFRNGFKVWEVDYLGEINKQGIKNLESTKQDKLKAGKDIEITEDNTINYVGKGGGGISPEDKAQIQKNKEDIQTLNNDIEELGNISNQNQRDINIIKEQQTQQDTQLGNLKLTKLDKSVYEADKPTFALNSEYQITKEQVETNKVEIDSIKSIQEDILEQQTIQNDNINNKLNKMNWFNGNKEIKTNGNNYENGVISISQLYWDTTDDIVKENNNLYNLTNGEFRQFRVDNNNGGINIYTTKKSNELLNNKKDKLTITTNNEVLTGDIVNGKEIYIKYVSGQLSNSQYVNLVNNAIVFDYNIMVCDIENGTYFSIDSKDWNSRSEVINLYNNSNNSIGINFIRNGFYRGWIKYWKV